MPANRIAGMGHLPFGFLKGCNESLSENVFEIFFQKDLQNTCNLKIIKFTLSICFIDLWLEPPCTIG